MVRALIEHAVKPAKEAFVLAMTAFSDRFQHRGAQRRVRINATSTDSAIAETIVMEN